MLTSKSLKIKYIKHIVTSKDYCAKRLELVSGQMVHWISSKSNVHTSRERNFCTKMAEMYHNRCIWYINKTNFYENS